MVFDHAGPMLGCITTFAIAVPGSCGVHNDKPLLSRRGHRNTKSSVCQVERYITASFHAVRCLPMLEGNCHVIEESIATPTDRLQWGSLDANEIEVEYWIVVVFVAGGSRAGFSATIIHGEWS